MSEEIPLSRNERMKAHPWLTELAMNPGEFSRLEVVSMGAGLTVGAAVFGIEELTGYDRTTSTANVQHKRDSNLVSSNVSVRTSVSLLICGHKHILSM